MATTGKNFIKHTNADLIGAAVGAAGAVQAIDPAAATQLVNGGTASKMGKLTIDPATDGLAKHGSATIALPSTTKVSIDLTNLATATASTDGDATFSSWSRLVIENTGAASFTIAPGSSNPANGIAGGSTPTITVQAGGFYVIDDGSTPNTVDSTHKIIDITPSATTSANITVSGA